MTSKGLNSNARAIIEAKLAKSVAAAAEAYAGQLRENVSAGPRSGVQYASLPRQSSSPSEYPQEQSGDLKDAVDARPTTNPLMYEAGFFDEDEKKLRALEFGSVHMRERAPLTRTAQDPQTRKEMLEAAKKAR